MAEHLTYEELQAGLPGIQQSPADRGELKAIVVRPATDERELLAECEMSVTRGVNGDNWALPTDGAPNPDYQISIMNARAIAMIAQTKDRWPLAGDNLYVDLDLSRDNLPPGQRLSIGSVVVELTNAAHNGCHKFANRFGADAKKFVNSDIGKHLNLRGIFAKVVTPGVIRVGDIIRKV